MKFTVRPRPPLSRHDRANVRGHFSSRWNFSPRRIYLFLGCKIWTYHRLDFQTHLNRAARKDCSAIFFGNILNTPWINSVMYTPTYLWLEFFFDISWNAIFFYSSDPILWQKTRMKSQDNFFFVIGLKLHIEM